MDTVKIPFKQRELQTLMDNIINPQGNYILKKVVKKLSSYLGKF